MSLRKILVSALCAFCAVSLLVPAAFAHGGCRGRYRRTVQPCAVESCTVMGYHYHSGRQYCGHTHGHTHGQGLCDGSCAPLCTVESCTLTGWHYHNGTVYCGGNHDSGYCGGSWNCCHTISSGSWGNWGGHHGGCHRW